MTKDEIVQAMRGLDSKISAYAKLIVEIGVAVQKDQEVVITCPVEAYDFGRRCAQAAYGLGAGHVTMFYNDPQINRLEYEHCPLSYFEKLPSWKRDQLDTLAADGACFLFLEGQSSSVYEGIDPAKMMARSRVKNAECKVFRSGLDFGRNAWCIAGVPVKGWAEEVFPEVSSEEAVYRLWSAILYVSRVTNDSPRSQWETHNQAFKKNLRFLNDRKFRKLHYVASNGTDFTLGLNEGGLWEGGASHATDGHCFFPNIPTEEVFTSPNCQEAEGIVYSALPLVHAGTIINDFWLKFEDGKVVDFGARQGYDTLAEILNTDEAASRLGECALISKNTPIRETGILFYNTLYDENASCHLALGTGFPECLEGGLDMSQEELLAHNVNHSHTHVDFMIGTDDLTITGICGDGEEIMVFNNGQWAWE